MAEHSSLGSGTPGAPASNGHRWSLVVPHRERLLRFACTMGAGKDSEDIVHEALLAAAREDGLDETRVWSLLVNILARRVADRYRQVARAQILVQQRGLLAGPRSFDHDVLDRVEAIRAAQQLVELLPREILDILWRHHVGGATWAELAGDRRVSADALKQRVSYALRNARDRIELPARRQKTVQIRRTSARYGAQQGRRTSTPL